MAELSVPFENAVEVSGQMLRTGYAPLQEGVMGAGDLKVTAGAVATTVDVAAGTGFVQGDGLADLGLYRARNDATKNSAAFEAGGIAAPHATLPRIDQIVARVYDHDVDGLGARKWRLAVVSGVATAGATLANRTGAAAVPNSAMRIADVLVVAGAPAVIPAGDIRDRRPWARGAFRRIKRNSNASAGSNYTSTSTSSVLIDGTNLQPRIECSGVPLRVQLIGSYYHSAANGATTCSLAVDGVFVDEGNNYLSAASIFAPEGRVLGSWTLIPAAGSHLLGPSWALVTAGTATLVAQANFALALTIEELIRQDADNT